MQKCQESPDHGALQGQRPWSSYSLDLRGPGTQGYFAALFPLNSIPLAARARTWTRRRRCQKTQVTQGGAKERCEKG